MDFKLKEELLDLAHLLHQAIISDDDRLAEAALADMADALASILPVDHSSDGRGGRPRPPEKIDRCKFKLLRADKMATMVMRGYQEGQPKPVVAHIQKFDTYCTAEIFRDGDQGPLVDLTVYGGFERTRRVTQGAMRGLMSSLGHKWRSHRNKRASENSATQVNG